MSTRARSKFMIQFGQGFRPTLPIASYELRVIIENLFSLFPDVDEIQWFKMADEGDIVRAKHNEIGITKNCPCCGRRKDISLFGRCLANDDGLSIYCRSCHNTKVKLSQRKVK